MSMKTLEEIRRRNKKESIREDADEKWITVNGTHVQVSGNGELKGSVGKKISNGSGGKKGAKITQKKAGPYTGERSGNKKLDNQFDRTRDALAEWEAAKQNTAKAYNRVCRKLGIKASKTASKYSTENQKKVRAVKDPDLIAAQKAERQAMGKHSRETKKLKDQYTAYRKAGGKQIRDYYSAASEWDDDD